MTEYDQESDDRLLMRCAEGDEEAFAVLYRRRQAGVYRFALHMSGRDHVAEEVTQEVFLALIREPQRYQSGKGTVVSWLYGIARNHVLRLLERDRRELPVEPEWQSEVPCEREDLLGRLTREQAIDALRNAILTLPETYREAVVLCDLEEMQYADAAAVLGVPVGTVRSRLNRGRGMLSEKLRRGNAMRCSA
ncbi:MAG TPA: RNA polymerase sigma factor [Bryobacteraceae bacterium]|nr:RNA polymerase sigma factor [Bryobacteraceae bacterium]